VRRSTGLRQLGLDEIVAFVVPMNLHHNA